MSCVATLGNNRFTQTTNSTSLTTGSLSVSAYSSIYVCLSTGSSKKIDNVKDSQGHNYNFVGRARQSPVNAEIWYYDGVTASTTFTVTAYFDGPCDATIEVVEIKGTATPSLDTSEVLGPNTGRSQVISCTVTPSITYGFGLMSACCEDNAGGTLTIAGIAPTVLIDANPTDPSASSIVGADLCQQFYSGGVKTMSASISGNSDRKWAAIACVIKCCDMGCNGVCNSGWIVDCAGTCYNPASGSPLHCADCAGVCDGSNVKDCYGTCYDPLTSQPPHVKGCDGICNSGKTVDCAGVCGGGAYEDCAGNCLNPLTCSTWQRLLGNGKRDRREISFFFVLIIIVVVLLVLFALQRRSKT